MTWLGRLTAVMMVAGWTLPAFATGPTETIRLTPPVSDVEAVQQRFDPLTGKLVPIVPGAQARPGNRLHVAPMKGGMEIDPQTGTWRMVPDQPANRYNPATGRWELDQPGISVDFTIADPQPAASPAAP